MRTIQVELYKFDELSQEAQDKAVQQLEQVNLHDDWFDFLYQKHTDIATEAGFQVDRMYFSGFWSQGDGAMFTYSRLDRKLLDQAVQSLALPQWKKEILQNGYLSGSGKHSGRYYHSRSVDHHIYLEVDGMWGYPNIEDLIAVYGEAVEAYVIETYEKLCDSLYEDLRETYYELTSREAILEAIEANDFEFYEDGELA